VARYNSRTLPQLKIKHALDGDISIPHQINPSSSRRIPWKCHLAGIVNVGSSGAKQGFLAPSVTMDHIYAANTIKCNTKLQYLASWALSIAEFSHCMSLFGRLLSSGAKSWQHGDDLTVCFESRRQGFSATRKLGIKDSCLRGIAMSFLIMPCRAWRFNCQNRSIEMARQPHQHQQDIIAGHRENGGQP
jgi:hypothetical protein